MNNKRFSIYLAALLAMLFWGISFVWTKIVFKYYAPVTTVFLRLVISSLVLYAVITIFKKKQKIERSDLGWFILSALFSPFIYFIGESYGLKYVTSTVTAVIIATIPVFTPIVAYFILKERLTYLNIIGLLISFFGVVIIVINQDFSLNVSPLGIGFLFIAVLAALGYSVIIKKLTYKYSATNIITYQNMIGALYFLPLFLIMDAKDFIKVTPNWELIGALLALSILASSLAFILFVRVIKAIGISKANVMANFIPVFTAIFSYFILYEIFNLNKIIGIFLVISGVIFSQLNNRRTAVKQT
ncbi:DMT family transporter [candidate division KSB1 bacterium]